MRTFSKFEIMGHVGKVETGDRVTHVSIAANYPRKDKTSGEWIDDPHWNRVSVFFEHERKRADSANKGDLVRVVGRMKDSSYEKNGETIYTTDRIVEEFDIVRRASEDGAGD